MAGVAVRKSISPAWLLLFLAPAIGEGLSGSQPPSEFFHPLNILIQAILYGGGAIIVRELVVRWQKGWASLFVLAAAYGIVEEGLLCKSFFDPNWVDVGKLGSYGRWGGVNWIWSLQLTTYHALVSIAASITIVELLFPNRRTDSWVSNRALTIALGLITVEVILGNLYITPYRPPLLPFVGVLSVVAFLVYLAWRLPKRILPPKPARPPRLRWLWLAGFSLVFLHFALPELLYHLKAPAVAAIVLWALIIAGGAALILRASGNGAALGDLHRFALALGPLSFFILLAPLQELSNANRPDNTAGMTLVGTAWFFLLFWLWRRLKNAPLQPKTAQPADLTN